MKIQLLQSIGEIPKGTILPVRKITMDYHLDLCSYQVVDGPYVGLSILSNSPDGILELPEEKTYTEKEVKTLKFFVNTLADCLISASDEIDRLRKELEKAQ